MYTKIAFGSFLAVVQAQQQTSTNWLEMQMANANLQFGLMNHGCNCPAVYDEFAIGGTSVGSDPVDSICQTLRQCGTCAGKNAQCGDAAAYDATTFNWEAGANGANNVCVNNVAGSCAAMKCNCHVNFANSMLNLGTNFTTFTSSVVNSTQCNDAAGTARDCCLQSDGKWKVYNGATQRCDNGVIGPNFQLGGVPAVTTCNNKPIDVTLFVDGSGSVQEYRFLYEVLPFCKDFAAALNLSPNGVNMQFVQWSSRFRHEFGYQDNVGTFQALVDQITYLNGATYTKQYLEQTYNNHIKGKGRAGAKQIIIDITDGKPTGDTVGNQVRAYTQGTLTPAGVVHIVVGIGLGIPMSTLKNMATTPFSAIHNGETVFQAVKIDKDTMNAIGESIGKAVCI